jgi:xanthine dehydrogenase small subunit
MLDGKELITVESLAGREGPLHPVQQAMVDCHASQCGFCTPGFVMALFAEYESGNGAAPSRERINDVLAGNLCRCTGYRPIVDAAQQAYGDERPVAWSSRDKRRVALLRKIARPGTLAIEGEGRRYFGPRTLDDLADLVERHPDAHLLAGGTDLGLRVTKQHRTLETIISVGAVAELAVIAVGDTHIEIGAGASYTDAHAVLGEHYPDFGELIRRLGSVQIRNLGTIGGNVGNASPIGDSPPALLALDATLVLRRGDVRRSVRLEDFFTGYRRTILQPSEFIERIDVPVPAAEEVFRCYKVSKRFDQDISAVCGAFRLRLEDGIVRDIRIGFGGMAATPARPVAVEEALTGRPWTEATVRSAQTVMDAAFSPLSDMRASAAYRRTVARNLLLKCFLETSQEAVVTRLAPA